MYFRGLSSQGYPNSTLVWGMGMCGRCRPTPFSHALGVQALVEKRNVLEAIVCGQLVASALGRTRSALEGCGQAAAAISKSRQQQQQGSGGSGGIAAVAAAAGATLRTSAASGHWAAYCRPPERALVYRVVAGIAGSVLPEEEEGEGEGGEAAGQGGPQRIGPVGTGTMGTARRGSSTMSPSALLRRGRAAGVEAVLAASGDATAAAHCAKQLRVVERVLQSREQAFHKQVREGGGVIQGGQGSHKQVRGGGRQAPESFRTNAIAPRRVVFLHCIQITDVLYFIIQARCFPGWMVALQVDHVMSQVEGGDELVACLRGLPLHVLLAALEGIRHQVV